MEGWLCREKGIKLMGNGKVQEAVTCDILLQVPHSVGAEVSLSSIEGGDLVSPCPSSWCYLA